jgi:L-seryl-tRNA(Ser) seleniumtransferase
VDLLLEDRTEEIPIRAMMRAPVEELRRRAEAIVAQVAELPFRAAVGEGQAQVGGGSLPRTVIPSVTVDLHPPRGTSLEALAQRLRERSRPLIGYVSGERLKLDLRTVFPAQDAEVVRILRSVASALASTTTGQQPS